MTNIVDIDNSIIISNVEDLKQYYSTVCDAIKSRMTEFQLLKTNAMPIQLFRELVFCILTANASAKMGLKAIQAIDDHTLLFGSEKDITTKLTGVYRFPVSRANYIVRTRQFLNDHCNLDIHKIFNEFKDPSALRFFLASNLIGIGYKECSHFLRNVGFKGYAILDKHVISMLNLLGCDVQKPRKKAEYVTTEIKMKEFAVKHSLDFDELDLLFWSYKTGEIIK
jgi:N-glycosylase/DNA lyase